jgi:phytol kinase
VSFLALITLSETQSFLETLSSLWFPLTVVILYLGMLILSAEGFNRLNLMDAEGTRKIVHIGAGNVILLAWWFNLPPWVVMGASFVASMIAIVSYFLPILPSLNSVGRKSLGTFFYAVSIGALAGWFWPNHQPQYTAIGILVMAWGDGLAAIIGQNWGKHPYQVFGMKKSWEGSLTMTLVSFLVTSLILGAVGGNIWQTCCVALLVSIVATALESFSKLGLDNLTVPIGSATLAFMLNQLWA